jgi:hypothetical protein
MSKRRGKYEVLGIKVFKMLKVFDRKDLKRSALGQRYYKLFTQTLTAEHETELSV